MLDSLESDRAFVAKVDAQIFDLEAQISALRITISELSAAKGPAEQRLDAYKYPVLTLPNEIIAEIFLQYLPPYPDAPPLVGLHSPVHLTHICGQWREIALTTPTLWSAVDLAHLKRRLSVKGAIWFAEMWWPRSTPYPLSIHANDYYDYFSIFSTALPHRARWQHLTLDLNLMNDADVRNALEGPMPLLRTLKILVRAASSSPLTLQSEDVPLLHSATLDDAGIRSFVLPSAQLTSLTLKPVHSGRCVPILLQTTYLVSLTMDLIFPYLDGDVPENPSVTELTLPRLERLVFLPTSDPDTKFLLLLDTPTLRCLTLPESMLGWPSSESTYIGTLKAFMSKCRSPLEELRIFMPTIPEHAYRDAFPLIPSIVHS
ncbi:F-box domain-containing protein [Favolaschia claudopus]|uniref:F-box domain-containing protein n=1 Tax=Favolaschia claudopus TaxID=2862362 RepID=A0AAW0ANR1_9AGAR